MLNNENRQDGNQNAATDSLSQGAANAGSNPLPSISLPKGGGAIRGMGEKFAANPVTGTGSMTVPIFTSPGRSGFGPQLSLSYDSGAGNGPFGFGWSMGAPSIMRKTDKGLPHYWPLQQPWNLATELLPGYTKGNTLIV
jgi:virulence plasmid B protein